MNKFPTLALIPFMCDVIGVRHRERETAQSVVLLEADDYWTDPYKLQNKWIKDGVVVAFDWSRAGELVCSVK